MYNNENLIPLAPSQADLLRLYAGIPNQFMNLCAKLKIESEIDEDKLMEALRYTTANLYYMTLRLHKLADGTLMQYSAPGDPDNIRLVDMKGKKEGAVEKYISKLASTPFPNDCYDCSLYRFELLCLDGGEHILCVVVHHVMADVYGMMTALKTFDEVYASMTQGSALPEIRNTTIQDIEDSIAYCSSRRRENDRKWWEEKFKEEPHFTSVNGKTGKEFIKGKNYGHSQSLLQRKQETLSQRIPGELVQQVNERAAQQNVAPMAYYLLAYSAYLCRVSDTNDVMLRTTVARRAKLVQRYSGLSRANMTLFRTTISWEQTAEEALLQVAKEQKEMYRHADILTPELLGMLGKMHPIPSGCTYYTNTFTYQPYFDFENTHLKYQAEQISAGVASIPLYLNIMPLDSTGDLWGFYQYAANYIKPESCRSFHAFMLKFIQAVLDRPETGMEELMQQCM